jgi:hypothetical protein
MTFDELKQIDSAVQSVELAARSAKEAAQNIRNIRRKNMPELNDVNIPFDIGYNSERKLNVEAVKAVRQATLDLLPDILRLAEIRLKANHKYQTALGRILENVVSNLKAAEDFGGYVLDDELREDALYWAGRRDNE